MNKLTRRARRTVLSLDVTNTAGQISKRWALLARLLIPLLAVFLLLGCEPSGSGAAPGLPAESAAAGTASSPVPAVQADGSLYAPRASDEGLLRDPVKVDFSELVTSKSVPPQFMLHIIGSVPTSCHVLRVLVPQADNGSSIRIEAYALVERDAVPVQVPKSFDETFNLDGFPAGQYTVWLNGVQVGEMRVP
ncbi:MAG: hypothetical protein ACYC6L_04580 [Anaerolineae bacterium]